MEAHANDRRPGLALALALLVALTFGLYARTAQHGFVAYDDPVYVSDNEVVARGLTLDGLRWAFGFHAGNWHPLTWISHMLDVELFGLDAGRHHLVNAALHALNAALLCLFVRRATGAGWTALLVAALFALHPLRVESVAWASERKDVLAGTFWFATLLAYERYARGGERGRAWRLAAVAAWLALGLMAKSMLVTLPVVMLVCDGWPLSRWRPLGDAHPEPPSLAPTHPGGLARGPGRAASGNRLLVEKLPLLALCLAVGTATLWIQRSEGAVGTLGSLSLLERASNAGNAYWTYVEQTFWPADLACFYPHPVLVTPREELVSALIVPGLARLAGLGLVAFFLLRFVTERPHLLAGWLWYLVAALPVIGFVQVGQQAHADRYTYLPTVGIALALAFELRLQVLRRQRLRRPAVAACALVLVALSALTWRQIGTWRDGRTLFGHALAVTERNHLAATFLGMAERRAGELEAARAHLEQALADNKHHVPAMLELGLTLEELGDLAGARRSFNRTLRNDPANAAARRGLERVERVLGPAPDGADAATAPRTPRTP
jgi:tetratricopeptide (TPR) repeat protein